MHRDLDHEATGKLRECGPGSSSGGTPPPASHVQALSGPGFSQPRRLRFAGAGFGERKRAHLVSTLTTGMPVRPRPRGLGHRCTSAAQGNVDSFDWWLTPRNSCPAFIAGRHAGLTVFPGRLRRRGPGQSAPLRGKLPQSMRRCGRMCRCPVGARDVAASMNLEDLFDSACQKVDISIFLLVPDGQLQRRRLHAPHCAQCRDEITLTLFPVGGLCSAGARRKPMRSGRTVGPDEPASLRSAARTAYRVQDAALPSVACLALRPVSPTVADPVALQRAATCTTASAAAT